MNLSLLVEGSKGKELLKLGGMGLLPDIDMEHYLRIKTK